MPTSRASAPRPTPGTDPLAEPLHRTVLHLLRLLRRADDASGVSPARLSALSVLVFGGPTTLGALAAAEGVSAPTMSRLVTELERDGYLRRRADPADARSARLEATARATRLLRAGRARRLTALTAALGTLDASQRDAIARAVAPLGALTTALAGRKPSTTPRASRRRFD